jgi:hypothetical protein
VARKYKWIAVESGVHEKLVKLKESVGAKTWAQFFDYLLQKYDACVEHERERLVKAVVCNDLREVTEYMVTWLKLLWSRLKNPDLVVAAVRFLKLDPSTGMYYVDLEKCLEAEGRAEAGEGAGEA